MPKARFTKFAERDYFPKSGIALDIGCGVGNESKLLLKKGFQVDAIDSKVVPEIEDTRFHFQKVDLSNFTIASEKYDLILAYYVLPFLKQRASVLEWINNIKKGLKPGGIAIITLFGDEHAWRNEGRHFFSTLEDAKQVIGDYIDLNEEKGLRKTMMGTEIFWHSWDFVIKKQ